MKTTQPRTRRLLNLFAIFVCYLIAAHLTGQTSGVQAQRIPPVPLPGGGGGGGEAKIDISKDGPYFGTAFLVNHITATVYVKHAPMLVEYQLGAESYAKLTLTKKISKKKEQTLFTINLEPTGSEIKEIIFMLPEELGEKPQIVALSVIAENVDPKNKKDTDFELYSLAMGKKAIGSVLLVDLSFQPDRFNSKQEKQVNYSFRSRGEFEKAYALIQLVSRTKDGKPAKENVNTNVIKRAIHRDETVAGSWDGKNEKQQVSMGRHQLLVAGWFTANKGGEWTNSWSRKRLLVQ
jgi:hypothetical protein